MKTRISFFIIFVLTWTLPLSAQNNTDSLKRVLRNGAVSDSARVEVWLQLHDQLKLSEFRSAALYIDSAYHLARDMNWEDAQVRTGPYYGTALSLTGRGEEARVILLDVVERANKLGMTTMEAYSYMTLGNISYDKSDYSEALPYYQKSSELYLKDDNYAGASGALIWIGIINQYALKDYDRAIDIYKEAAEMAERGNSTLNKGYIYANLSNIYYEWSEYDSAIRYIGLSNDIKRQFNDKRGLGNGLESLANCYFDMMQYPLALQYYEESLRIREELADSTGLASSYINMGRVYGEQGRISLAREAFKNGRELAIRIGYDEALQQAYLLESNFLERGANFREALTSYKLFKGISDSLFNTESRRILEELQVKYDTEKKEQQIALQQATLGEQEAKLERNQLLIAALVLVAVLLLLVLVLIRARSRKEKALIKKEAELKLREAEINAVINSQEKERNRFARDLHDGFGQLISVLKLNLGQLKDLNGRDFEKRDEIFKSGEKVINEMYGELRNICFDLMPQTLVKKGLSPALKELGQRINQNTRVNCEVMIFDLEERLPELMEISLFRITQEWVNNVLKYASANSLTIQVTREEAEVTLTIEDDGNGFDPRNFYEGKGNGWRNIQSRLNQVGGTFDLDSRPGLSGTMVTLNMQVSEQEIPTGTEHEITA